MERKAKGNLQRIHKRRSSFCESPALELVFSKKPNHDESKSFFNKVRTGTGELIALSPVGDREATGKIVKMITRIVAFTEKLYMLPWFYSL